jgi:cobalt/nickel transport system permease protein
MQPIHLAIGIVEGLVTAAVLCYVHAIRPELIDSAAVSAPVPIGIPLKKVIVSFVVLAAITGGLLSIFASAYPDGREWSMEKTSGTAELEREGQVYAAASSVVETTAFMPDYAFANDEGNLGTSVAGIVGSGITVLLAGGIGLLIRLGRKKHQTV